MKRTSQREQYRIARAALWMIASSSHTNIPYDAEIRAKSSIEAWYHDYMWVRGISQKALRLIGEIPEKKIKKPR